LRKEKNNKDPFFVAAFFGNEWIATGSIGMFSLKGYF